MARSVLFVQWGDYREAFERLSSSGPETYYQQRRSVKSVGTLREQFGPVTVLCVAAGPYDVMLTNGVRAIGLHVFGGNATLDDLAKTIDTLDPSDLIVWTPVLPVLRQGLRRGAAVLPVLADSFPLRGLRNRLRNLRRRRVLNDRRIRFVCNHQMAASRNLVAIGVRADKVVPWDWPPPATPADFPPKRLRTGEILTMSVIGRPDPSKGLTDCIEAVRLLARAGMETRLRVIGMASGDGLGIDDPCAGGRVEYLGRLDHRQVLETMHASDLVVLPSRPDYPEGQPFTICDALCTRTPMVASTHPMFVGRLSEGQGVVFFEAGRAQDLADKVRVLTAAPAQYERMSRATDEVWRSLQLDTSIEEVVERWLRRGPQDIEWLRNHTLHAMDARRPAQSHAVTA